jgi:predicted CXXCH cytochrome family protein
MITCESCHADYRKEDTVEIESQGEIFCIGCHEEWKLYQR